MQRTRRSRHRIRQRTALERIEARLGQSGGARLKAGLQRAFAADGLLAAAIEGFKLRPQQLEMAQAIHDAIERTAVLVAEAGTGTGKTFAYLVPALLAGGKVIVSTGTKTLQDQLFDRDLPAVRKALAAGASTALLKGRSNYVCLYRLRRSAAAGVASREDAAQLRRIERFAAASASGDRADLADVPEDAPVWAHATSTRDNCLGQGCPDYGECFVMRARRNALAADVVVINHHLFFADVVLRDEGISELLPACNTVIFDEAHQLPETARLFFGETVSSTQLMEIARDARAELRAAGGASPELEALANRMEKAARDLRLSLGETVSRYSWAQALRLPGFADSLELVQKALNQIREPLEAQAERSEGLAACARRAATALAGVVRMRETDPAGEVRWVEVFGHGARLHVTPLSSAELFSRQMNDHPRAWIFTSATLAMGEEFGHFTRELGLGQAATRRWASPFDFAQQALLYLPKGLPADPNDATFTDAVVDAALPVIEASGGRAFLLFTTLRALRRAHERLRGLLSYPLLVQGTGSRSELLARFRSLGNAVLLGSQSFWEGVDVRGEALSVVVIDKLPFAPPDDPVLAARIEAIRAREGNPFTELQLPQAVLQLKQGAGRLIRDDTDRGVLMLCDPRLLSKAYGRQILKSLPPMKPTRSLSEVADFLGARPRRECG
ncbi:MAG TPA: ATP-dependent DNA helicase [Burkholderiales bacterium]|nr:ATP-dependent DNA helicase [Burkholderiales bacterium]